MKDIFHIRPALLGSVAALTLGNIFFWFLTPSELFETDVDAVEGTAFLGGAFMISGAPVLAVVGWFIGKWFARGRGQREEKPK